MPSLLLSTRPQKTTREHDAEALLLTVEAIDVVNARLKAQAERDQFSAEFGIAIDPFSGYIVHPKKTTTKDLSR